MTRATASASLIAAGLALATAAAAQPEVPPGDSYLCYKAGLARGEEKFTPAQKTLEDQFGTLVADVKEIAALCNPTQTAENSAVHAVGYTLAPAKEPPQAKFVKSDHTAVDQFGIHPLTVVKPIEVRAPSAKVLGAGGTGPVDTTGVDHFECYKATPAKGTPKFVPPAPLAITDQFGTQSYTVKKITKLCTPVNKNGEDATAPQHVGHLVCYQAKLPAGAKFAPQTVSVNNDNFGPAVLVAKAVLEVCVPAFIDGVGGGSGIGPIDWAPCTGGGTLEAGKAECGFVTAPLDYDQPAGEKIKIAVSRVRHTVADAKARVMLVNPGGPGGSGPHSVAARQGRAADAGEAYDWIGFDPRGVGASTPALSCIPDYGGYNRPEYDPTKADGVVAAWLREPSSTRRRARPRAARLLGHLTTKTPQGTWTRSARRWPPSRSTSSASRTAPTSARSTPRCYPQNLRRAVFDGVVDHRGVWYDDNLDQDVAFQKTIEVFFDWVAKNDAAYHLGNSGEDVERLYYGERDQLREPAGGKIGPSEWTDIFLQAGYSSSAGRRSPRRSRSGCTTATPRGDGALRRHGHGGRRQRLRDLPRRPVHRHPVAAAVRQGARRQRAGGARGAVRDLGKRLVQRPVLHWKAPARTPVAIAGAARRRSC